MIQLTRLNHLSLVLNCDLIEHVEQTPDTVVTLTSGQKFMVRETPEEITRRVIVFRQEIWKTASFACRCSPVNTLSSRLVGDCRQELP